MQNCSLTLLNCDGQLIRGGRIKLSLLLQVVLLYRFILQNTGGNWKQDHFCLLGHSILLCVSFACGGHPDFYNTITSVCWSHCHCKNLNPIHFIALLTVLLALHCDLSVREVDGAILGTVQAISRLKLLSLRSKTLSGLIMVHLSEKTAHKLFHHINVEHSEGLCWSF